MFQAIVAAPLIVRFGAEWQRAACSVPRSDASDGPAPHFRNGALLRTTNATLRIRTAARRFLTAGQRLALHQSGITPRRVLNAICHCVQCGDGQRALFPRPW